MASGTVGVELRTQWEAKRDEAERLLLKQDSTKEDLDRADQLQKDMDDISKKIDQYNADRQRELEVRQRLEASKKAMAQPQRRLPFSAGVSTRVEGNSEIDEKSYEFKTFDGEVISSSVRSEAKRFLLPTIDPESKRFVISAGDAQFDKLAPTGGFKSLGHFAWSLVRRGRDGRGDPHSCEMLKNWQDLQTKAPSGMFEESDPDGGDLIPREFSNKIYERMMATNQILSYLEGLPLSGNTLTIPALKEDSRVDGSRHGGVLGYWEGEADQYTKTNPKFRNVNLKLHKLTVLTYVTEELLMDSAVALESYLGRLVPKEVNFKINDALINGKGGGMPLGVMNANSKVSVAKVTSQVATTFVYQNVLSMWARAIAGQRGSAIWLYNQDVEPQLYQLNLPVGGVAAQYSGVAAFTPNEVVQFKLMGRPALVMEQCQTLGTSGDVILFCPEGYATILKGGLQSFMSMHLRFDYDEFAYKWRFRMDAQPYDDVALTPFKGTNTYSSVVVCDARS